MYSGIVHYKTNGRITFTRSLIRSIQNLGLEGKDNYKRNISSSGAEDEYRDFVQIAIFLLLFSIRPVCRCKILRIL